MSRNIDTYVASMEFDNKQFEAGVKTSLSTLDKLKKSLNLDSSSKSLSKVSTAMGSTRDSLKELEYASYKAGFSWKDVLAKMSSTAEWRYAQRAVDALENSVKSLGNSLLGLTAMKSGFQEYETQMGAVQTILANTSSKGSTLDDVNKALDELNTYADKTIYNFTEMTRNIGTFTAAGVDLDKSVTSIKGIANLAAVSGSTSQQASTAMYQLSQALASGTVKLMDWNSVVNAGMGGEVFQTALKRTAKQMGYNVDEMIKKYGSFRESLTKGEWLTAEVLTETLSQLAGAYSEADLIAKGYTKSQAKEITELAKTAESAATDVKTFTQLMDTMKEAAQSGWSQTWKLLVGDFAQAKSLFGYLANGDGGKTFNGFNAMIEATSKSRNDLLSGAMASKWDRLTEKVTEAGASTEDFEDAIKKAAKESGKDIDKIIEKSGSLESAFKEGYLSADILKKALDSLKGTSNDFGLGSITDTLKNGIKGDDVKKIEKALKSLGYTLIGKDGIDYSEDGYFGTLTRDAIKDFQKKNNLKVTGIVDSETLKALDKATSKTVEFKDSIDDLVDGVDKLGGRDLLIEALKNSFGGLVTIFDNIKGAWGNTFKSMTSEDLYGIIEKINGFSKSFKKFAEDNELNIYKTFKGLFSVVEIIKTIAGGGLTFIFKTLGKILGHANINVLELTASMGDAIVKFRDWLFDGNKVAKWFDELSVKLGEGIIQLRDWIKEFKNSPEVQEAFHKIGESAINAFNTLRERFPEGIKKIKEWFAGLKDYDGFSLENITAAFQDFKTKVIDFFVKNDNGTSIFDGLINALKNLKTKAKMFLETIGVNFGKVGEGISNFFKSIRDWFSDNKGAIYAIGALAAIVWSLIKIGKFVKSITDIFGLGSIGEALGDFANAVKLYAKANLIKSIAISIGILAGSLAVLALLPYGKLWSAVGALLVVGAGLVTAVVILTKLGDNPADFTKIAGSLLMLAGSLVLLSFAAKRFGEMDPGTLLKAGGALVVLYAGMRSLTKLMSGKMGDFVGFGKMMLALSGALIIMAVAINMFGHMKLETLLKGGGGVLGCMAMLAGFIYAITSIQKITGQTQIVKFGGMMLALSGALILMAGAITIFGHMKFETLLKGGGAIIGCMVILGGFIAAMMTIQKKTGQKNIAQFGGMMLALGGALLLMAAAVALLGLLNVKHLAKGIIAVGLLTTFVAVLLKCSAHVKRAKVGPILALAGAVGILAAALVVLSFVDTKKLLGASAALGIVMGMFALMGVASKTLSVKAMLSIGIMTAVVGGLTYMLKSLSEVPSDEALGAAKALSLLIISLTGCCVLLGALGLIGPSAFIGIGVLAALLAVIGVVAAIAISSLPKVGEKLSTFMEKLEPFIEGAKKIDAKMLTGVKMLSEIFTTLTKASIIDKLSGGNSLENFGGQLKAFAKGLNDFSIEVSKDTFNTTKITEAAAAADALVTLGNKLPQTEDLMGWLTGKDDLGSFGSKLAAFALGLTVFNDAVTTDTFDTEAIIDAATAAQSLVDLGNKLPETETFLQWLADDHDLGAFGRSLVPFAFGLTAFSSIVSDDTFDTEAIQGAATAAQSLVDLGISLPDTETLYGWLNQDHDLGVFGRSLVPFAIGLTAFSSIVSDDTFDTEAIKNASIAAQSLVDLGNSLPETETFLQWLGNDHDLGAFGRSLIPFAIGLQGFNVIVTDETFDTEAIIDAATAAQSLVDLGNSLPKTETFLQWLGNDHNLGKFGWSLMPFAQGLKSFSDTVGEDGLDTGAIEAAATASESLVTLGGKLPETETFLQWLGDDHNLGVFGTELSKFGSGLKSFSDSVSGENAIDKDAIKKAADATGYLTTLANNLPTTESFWQLLAGDKNLGDFGINLGYFGEGLKAFSDSVSGDNAIDTVAIAAAVSAAEGLSTVANALPKTETFLQWLGSDGDLGGFGTEIGKLGGYLKSFSDSVAGINVANVAFAVWTAEELAGLAETVGGEDKIGNLWYAGSTIGQFGKDINTFYTKIKNVDAPKMGTIATALKDLASISVSDAETLGSFVSSLSKVGTDGVDAFLKAFSDADAKAVKAGGDMMKKLILGVKAQTTVLNHTFTQLTTGALSTLRSKYEIFHSVGKYLVQGFANGISANTYLATAKASLMASAAVSAAKSILLVNSPSKVFMGIGGSIPEGFAKGIDKLSYLAEGSATSMAKSAIEETRNALSSVASAITSDLNSQPTIRPVLDLSDIRAGASTIGGMFSMTPSVSAMANLGSISASMNSRQNGGNGDVVSAIKDLGRKIGSMPSTVNNINGISYDDGSNITSAIETIVRAARVERRT